MTIKLILTAPLARGAKQAASIAIERSLESPKAGHNVLDNKPAVIESRVAVSLGLIITELVINALKYAFPDGRTGMIVADYKFRGTN